MENISNKEALFNELDNSKDFFVKQTEELQKFREEHTKEEFEEHTKELLEEIGEPLKQLEKKFSDLLTKLNIPH